MSKMCEELHKYLTQFKRYNFPYDEKTIPLNGIYILYENGEIGHGGDRIVRIGTHTGENQLRSRLRQHFIKENKDRSIFRKNIGRCLLNKRSDKYLEKWELDLTSREEKEKNSKIIDKDRQAAIEREVTNFIQNNFTFCVIEVKEKIERLWLESKLISTISICKDCCSSENWLGLHSPKEKIKESGMWLVNELYKEPFTEDEFNKFKLMHPWKK